MRFLQTGFGSFILMGFVFCAGIFGCNNNGSTDNRMSKTTKTNTLTMLALGDSYTIGESVEPHERWPVLLIERMRNDGFEMENPEIIAQTGWTTGELSSAIASLDPSGPYDLVTLLIGVNNQYRGLDTADYRRELRSLIALAIRLTGNDPRKVICVSIPDYGVTPFAIGKDPENISREIDMYNSIMEAEAIVENIKMVDITPVSRLAGSDSELLAEDGLHPSAKMYRQWVEEIYPLAVNVLKYKRK